MKEKVYLIGISLFLTAFWGCQEQDMTESNNGSVTVDLAFSLSHVSKETRQSLAVVQAEGQPFRGISDLWIIPFSTGGAAVKADDAPYIETLVPGNVEGSKVDNRNYYYLSHYSMSTGADRVLVYGKVPKGSLSDAQNGKLVTTLSNERKLPADFTFNLSSIHNTTDVHADAQALADYMTSIANTEGWSTTPDASLKALYLDFIHADSEGSGLMAGSAAHVKAYVKALKDQIKDNTDEISGAIVGKIDDTGLNACLNNGYPSASLSLGLPDGAAVLRWTGSEFSVRTQATTLDNINAINRYTYPAELWYMVDSPIKTSSDKVEKIIYQNNDWSVLLDNYYKGSSSVHGGTQSVAVEKPLQYGVGRLEMTLNRISGTLKDAKEKTLDYENNAAKLPLTAVIIGGQHTVGFDFKPHGEQSDVDARFIYDPEPKEKTVDENGKYIVNTLVLQSYDNEKVPIVLEFENLTGNQFVGKDGIVYPNTKFYLIGIIDPAEKKDDELDYTHRVFTQDYTTKVTLKVESLANAYSCMPDLLSPRLELGVQVQTKWIQSTTSTVRL